jgi:hypothetical protein
MVDTATLSGSTPSGDWNYRTNQAIGDPGSGNVAVDATPTTASIAVVDRLAVDHTTTLGQLVPGDHLLCVVRTSAGDQVEYAVAADPTMYSTWVSIPITVVGTVGTAPNNNADILVYFVRPVVGGGGWPTITDVKNWLRLGPDTSDDPVVADVLAAAIAWVTDRVEPKWVPGSGGSNLATLTAATGTAAIGALAVTALPHALAAGNQVTLFSGANSLLCTVAGGGAATGATTINVNSVTPAFNYPAGAAVVEMNNGTLPDPLFQVTVEEAGRLYRRRDSVDGTIGWGDMGIVRIGPKDPDIESKITPYLNIILG